jgi:hypothetical protein
VAGLLLGFVQQASSSMPTNGSCDSGMTTAAVAALSIQQQVSKDNDNIMTTTQQPTRQPTKQPTWRGNRIE